MIEMILNNSMWIDCCNHLLLNWVVLHHPMNRIEVQYPIKMDQNLLQRKKSQDRIRSIEMNSLPFSPGLLSSSLKPSLAKPER